MKNYFKIMEYFWLVVGILTTAYAVFSYFQEEESSPLTYYLPAMAFVLYGMRRWYNSKLKKEE